MKVWNCKLQLHIYFRILFVDGYRVFYSGKDNLLNFTDGFQTWANMNKSLGLNWFSYLLID